MGSYAQNTTVSIERSQSEISNTLRRFGAQGVATGWDGDRGMVAFRFADRQVRFIVPLPDPESSDFRLTPTGLKRTAAAARTAYEAETRRRWRSMALVVKAKLEAVSSGIVDFETEFLGYTLLPGGMTVQEHLGPQIEAAIEAGQMPNRLQIGSA